MSTVANKGPLLVRITYVRCGKHKQPYIRTALKTLGFRKLQQSIVHKNVRPIRGLIFKLRHYIEVEPIYPDDDLMKEAMLLKSQISPKKFNIDIEEELGSHDTDQNKILNSVVADNKNTADSH
eukprot:TRINITY_DN9613_c0_g1_i1.p1 TRINITY_DN9613_c0_g1~~TRINITY_DN9613_c0_g1_i1.p1  ORF type:complete len:123 (-),score=14.61 TRINITY_DN9613_c0_g1_i1:4-372(-)